MDSQSDPIPNRQPTPNPSTLKEHIQDDGESSSWSLDSLQDIKHVNLRQLQAEQEPHEHQPKVKEPLQVKFPEKPIILANAPLHEVGKVIYVVGELLIVESHSGALVVDLENWLCDQQRNLLGFVIDVLGKVQNPFYAIRPEIVTNMIDFLGKTVYYLEGSSKILRDEDIKSMRSKSAIDAEQQQQSSSSDQEHMRIERDFSEQLKPKHEVSRERPNNFRPREGREQVRDRTREVVRNNRNVSRSRNQHNQRYLESVYSSHYNQMMRMYNSNFQPNHPNNLMQNPYVNPQMAMSMNMPMQMPTNPIQMQNVAQFGNNNNPNQFYGQTFPTNNINPMNQTGQPGIFGYPSQGQTNPNFFATSTPSKNQFNSPK